MEYDTHRAEEKQAELVTLAVRALHQISQGAGVGSSEADLEKFATSIIEEFAVVTPPESAPLTIGMVTMRSGGYGGARSTKPGNILLNLQKLMTAVASGVLTVVGVVSAPWTAPFAAIVVWDSIWSGLNVDISEREAAVLWTMWKLRDSNNCVPKDSLLESVNSELANSGRGQITQAELEAVLQKLKAISCIDNSESNPSSWWLREWVNTQYR